MSNYLIFFFLHSFYHLQHLILTPASKEREEQEEGKGEKERQGGEWKCQHFNYRKPGKLAQSWSIGDFGEKLWLFLRYCLRFSIGSILLPLPFFALQPCTHPTCINAIRFRFRDLTRLLTLLLFNGRQPLSFCLLLLFDLLLRLLWLLSCVLWGHCNFQPRGRGRERERARKNSCATVRDSTVLGACQQQIFGAMASAYAYPIPAKWIWSYEMFVLLRLLCYGAVPVSNGYHLVGFLSNE